MKPLIKLILVLFAGFAVIMLLIRLSGFLTLDMIEVWLEVVRNISPVYVSLLVIGLLIVDLFLSVPTLALTMLAGFFLGHMAGAASALAGLLLAGMAGYGFGQLFGERMLNRLIGDLDQRSAAKEAFERNGFVMILLARAIPMFPEVTACMAGMMRMSFAKFVLALSLGSVPYVLIASYAGSISTVSNPEPAIIAALSISGFLWLSWFLHHRYRKKKQPVR